MSAQSVSRRDLHRCESRSAKSNFKRRCNEKIDYMCSHHVLDMSIGARLQGCMSSHVSQTLTHPTVVSGYSSCRAACRRSRKTPKAVHCLLRRLRVGASSSPAGPALDMPHASLKSIGTPCLRGRHVNLWQGQHSPTIMLQWHHDATIQSRRATMYLLPEVIQILNEEESAQVL